VNINFKNIFFSVLVILCIGIGYTNPSNAQTIEVLAGNTLNGAMNGVLLGGATMALQNSNDFDPVRIGAGAGTLYGIGVGIYDITRVPTGQQPYVTGTFNDGTNSSVIVLLDTFYGAAAGAVISTAVSLITNESIEEGLRYGAGAGAWAGFGFGLFDAFVLAKKPGEVQAYSYPRDNVDGMVTFKNRNEKIKAGFLSVGFSSYTSINTESIEIHQALNLEMLNLKIRL